MTTPLPRLVAAAAVGGALGGLLRFQAGLVVPDDSGFPWTTFTVNVTGALLLALLPAVDAVRGSPLLAVALGPGLLGGFTTLSATSEQGRRLINLDRPALAAAYLVGTLAASLLAVALAARVTDARERRVFAAEEGDL